MSKLEEEINRILDNKFKDKSGIIVQTFYFNKGESYMVRARIRNGHYKDSIKVDISYPVKSKGELVGILNEEVKSLEEQGLRISYPVELDSI